MSDSQPSLQELVLSFETSQLANYIVLAATAIWIYEYNLTFWTMEIPIVWLQPWNVMSVLYLVNRYSFFFSCVGQTIMLLLPGRTESFCHDFFYAPLTFQTIASLCTSALFVFRVYVLYERSLTVLIVLAVITIGAQVQSIWSLSLAVGVATNDILQTGLPDDTISVCVFATRLDSQLELFSRIQLTVVVTELLFDGIVFAMTLRKTYQHARQMRVMGESSITHLLLRDGTLYFFFSFLIAIAVTGTQLYSMTHDNAPTGLTSGFFLLLTPLYNALPNILVNRLYLNLKAWHTAPDADSSSRRTGQLTGIEFAPDKTSRLLGNIGGPLRTLDEIDEWSVDENGFRDSEDTVGSDGPGNGTANVSRIEAEVGDEEAEVPLTSRESA